METRIKELREDNDKKQIEIAMLLGITQQQYSLYEQSKRSLQIEYLPKLAIFYNTSIDYLLRSNKSKIALSSYEFRGKKITVCHKTVILCNVIYNKFVNLYQ